MWPAWVADGSAEDKVAIVASLLEPDAAQDGKFWLPAAKESLMLRMGPAGDTAPVQLTGFLASLRVQATPHPVPGSGMIDTLWIPYEFPWTQGLDLSAERRLLDPVSVEAHEAAALLGALHEQLGGAFSAAVALTPQLGVCAPGPRPGWVLVGHARRTREQRLSVPAGRSASCRWTSTTASCAPVGRSSPPRARGRRTRSRSGSCRRRRR